MSPRPEGVDRISIPAGVNPSHLRDADVDAKTAQITPRNFPVTQTIRRANAQGEFFRGMTEDGAGMMPMMFEKNRYKVRYIISATAQEGDEFIEATSEKDAEDILRTRGKLILRIKQVKESLASLEKGDVASKTHSAAQPSAPPVQNVSRKTFMVQTVEIATGARGGGPVSARTPEEATAMVERNGYHVLAVEDISNRPSGPEQPLRCPHCGSTHLVANRKGFSLTKAALGILAIGPVGGLAGAHGAGDIIITCLACGQKCAPGLR
jgi:hypothetical protein